MDPRRLIWFALTMSTVIYAAIAYTVTGSPARAFEASVRRPMTLILYGAALSMFIAGLAFNSVPKVPPATTLIVTMAMFESCTLFGLVAAFLASDWRLYVPAWIVALIGFVRQFPADAASGSR